MASVEKLTVFLASPGDVQAEREAMRAVIEDLNRTVGRDKNIIFDVVGWDTDSFPSFGGDGQEKLNDEIGDMTKYDLFVAIMWNRFGYETPRAASGTVEEFERAVKAFEQHGKPDIMFYFKQEAYNPANAKEAEQKFKVMQFREELFSRGLIGDFTDTADFRAKFNRQVQQWLASRNVQPPSPPAPVQPPHDPSQQDKMVCRPSSPAQVNSSGMWVLLNEKVFLAESIKDADDGSIVIETTSNGAEDDAFVKSLRAQPYQRSEPLLFAIQNDGGFATVQPPTSIANASGKVWSIVLKPQDVSSGMFNEIGINGYSADDIATLRARLLLLNELPSKSTQNRTDPNDLLLLTTVRGLSGRLKVVGSIFPEIWERMRDQEEIFLPLARLWAIFNLKTSGTVEHVLELTLGPRDGNMLHVKFRGRRHRQYQNVDPPIITVEGDCDLTAKPPLEDR